MNRTKRMAAAGMAILAVAGAFSAGAAALTGNRNTPERTGTLVSLNVASGAVIYAGAMVAVTNGYAVPAADLGDYAVVGRAQQKVDNSGSNYAETNLISVRRGVFAWANADAITVADVGKLAYVTDDQTVNKAGGGQNIIAGSIVDVDASGVWVDTGKIGPSGAATPTSLAVSGNATVGGTLGVTGAATLTGNALANELDARTATALLLGKATATSVTLGASDAATAIAGNATVAGTLGVTGNTSVSNFTATGTVTLPAGSVANAALVGGVTKIYTNTSTLSTSVVTVVNGIVTAVTTTP